MYAIIVSGGKQFRVSEGDELEVEKLNGEVGSKVELPILMKADGENVDVNPTNLFASAEIVSHGRGKKIIVFKYKSKKNERKKIGHRQSFSRIKILTIG